MAREHAPRTLWAPQASRASVRPLRGAQRDLEDRTGGTHKIKLRQKGGATCRVAAPNMAPRSHPKTGNLRKRRRGEASSVASRAQRTPTDVIRHGATQSRRSQIRLWGHHIGQRLQRSERRGLPEESAAPENTWSGRPDNRKNKRKAATVFSAAEGRNKQHPGRAPGGGAPRPGRGFQKPAPAKLGDGKWCEIHRTDRHDLTDCRLVKGLAEDHWKERSDRCPDGKNAPEEVGLGFQEPR
ncbi:hypothetical protein C2845_PM07G11630 [Panicum miliaceum]|uniref:Uncharacterized protein n=1 Tax=Panicum miliaceum TaxID=4540 RepID=A0A3L6SHC5_PANMI|nr:hypothetical protein C2845_PM07G11630 [Panicum miliaceum]